MTEEASIYVSGQLGRIEPEGGGIYVGMGAAGGADGPWYIELIDPQGAAYGPVLVGADISTSKVGRIRKEALFVVYKGGSYRLRMTDIQGKIAESAPFNVPQTAVDAEAMTSIARIASPEEEETYWQRLEAQMKG